MIFKQLKMEGFMQGRWAHKHPESLKRLMAWMKEVSKHVTPHLAPGLSTGCESKSRLWKSPGCSTAKDGAVTACPSRFKSASQRPALNIPCFSILGYRLVRTYCSLPTITKWSDQSAPGEGSCSSWRRRSTVVSAPWVQQEVAWLWTGSTGVFFFLLHLSHVC